jgi:anti-anti-sigma factor
MRLQVHDTRQDDCHTLRLVGELDLSTAPALQATIDRLCADGAREIVLDLHELLFIDSTGLRLIVTSRHRCALQGCDFSLIRAQPSAQHLFELTGVIERLSLRGRDLARRLAKREAPAAGLSTRFRPDLEVSLDLNLDAPRAARTYIRELLRDDGWRQARDPAVLLTGELITPIVQQGTSVFLEAGELRAWLRPGLVRVELRVPDELLSTPPERAEPRYDELLLDAFADRWAVDLSPPTGSVWFEIDRLPAAHPPGAPGGGGPDAGQGSSGSR